MKTKYILLAVFLLVVAAQLYVPASMIMNQEDILASGSLYRFKIRPIDPNDPMRGKYIRLWYADDNFTIPDSVNFSHNQRIFAQIYEDDDGFAKIKNVFKTRPVDELDFIEATVGYPSYFNDSTHITINYPFDRYYLEEHKAPVAEEVYRESQSESGNTWAVVKIKNGNAALEDVMIDGIPITLMVNDKQNKNQ